MKALTLKAYVRPEVQAIKIETQSVLAASGDPDVTIPEMGWGTQEKDYEESAIVSDITNILQ